MWPSGPPEPGCGPWAVASEWDRDRGVRRAQGTTSSIICSASDHALGLTSQKERGGDWRESDDEV